MGTNEKWRKTNRKQLALIILLLILVPYGIFFYYEQLADSSLLRCRFKINSQKTSVEFKLEIANRPKSRAKGLMFRKELEPNRGMLFVFPEVKIQTIWMKNTFVSLDLLFLNEDLEVVGLIESVPILNEKARSIKAPSKYVVELPAGSCKAQGIKVGARLVPKGPIPEGI
jgi:uncharacterized membrane protein (UPF0127 family)